MRQQQVFFSFFNRFFFDIMVFEKIKLFSGSTGVCDSCYTERYIMDLQTRVQ